MFGCLAVAKLWKKNGSTTRSLQCNSFMLFSVLSILLCNQWFLIDLFASFTILFAVPVCIKFRLRLPWLLAKHFTNICKYYNIIYSCLSISEKRFPNDKKKIWFIFHCYFHFAVRRSKRNDCYNSGQSSSHGESVLLVMLCKLSV